MERAIGEVFDFNGVKLQVKDAVRKISCNGCYFLNGYKCKGKGIDCKIQIGKCFCNFRTDHKSVIFVEVNKDKED